jgi:hypothetical protein
MTKNITKLLDDRTDAEKAIFALSAVLAPLVNMEADTVENQYRSFHILFDRFVAAAHKAAEGAKAYSDSASERAHKLLENDVNVEDIRTLTACEQMARAQEQENVARTLKVILSAVYTDTCGETFSLAAWETSLKTKASDGKALDARREAVLAMVRKTA